MTIRTKVRILLLVSVSLTIFYVISHVYHQNTWFNDEKTVALKQQQQQQQQQQHQQQQQQQQQQQLQKEVSPSSHPVFPVQNEAVVNPAGDNLQFNAAANTTKPLPDDVAQVKVLLPFNNDLPAQYQPDDRSTSHHPATTTTSTATTTTTSTTTTTTATTTAATTTATTATTTTATTTATITIGGRNNV
jgi:hypothetical protein